MQQYYLDCKGITGYVNTLVDAQDKEEQENKPITDTTIIIIGTNAMTSMEQCSRANEEITVHVVTVENNLSSCGKEGVN